MRGLGQGPITADIVTDEVGKAVASGSTSMAAGILSGALTAGVGFGVTYGISQLVGHFTRKGRRKEEATQVVNEAEIYMKENLEQFLAGNVGKEEAVGNFERLWNFVVLNCGRVGGGPGDRCVSERRRGGRFDWFKWYLDPILESGEEEAAEVVGAGAGLSTELVAGVALVGLGLVYGLGGKS